mmetsp:Transcript_4392/g.9491  ORF Transcript_4392/g.9491 Transcript_4392/m.9491 type:complete len:85 (-) Transcript_4392:84-338(-)
MSRAFSVAAEKVSACESDSTLEILCGGVNFMKQRVRVQEFAKDAKVCNDARRRSPSTLDPESRGRLHVSARFYEARVAVAASRL